MTADNLAISTSPAVIDRRYRGRNSNTVRAGVLQFELVENLTVAASQIRSLAFPLVELTERHGIAVERRKTAAIFKDGVCQQIRIKAACGCEGRPIGALQLLKKRLGLPVPGNILFQG